MEKMATAQNQNAHSLTAQDNLKIAENFARLMYDQEMAHVSSQPHFVPVKEIKAAHESGLSMSLEIISKVKNISPDQIRHFRQKFSALLKEFVDLNSRKPLQEPLGPAIGIDLGTTYCCVAVCRGDTSDTEIIYSATGDTKTPSYIAFPQKIDDDDDDIDDDDDDADELVCGQTAKDLAHENPEGTIFDVKRMIGRKFGDTELERDIKLWPFKLLSDENRNGEIRVKTGKTSTHSPTEITGILLKHLKDLADAYLDFTVTHAVVAVPAHYTAHEEDLTREACELAGLNVIQFVKEPVAAAIAYKIGVQDSNGGRDKDYAGISRKCLIFDFGGGTLDISIVSINCNRISVLATGGDSHLGGEDIDRNMLAFCIAQFTKEHGKGLQNAIDSKDATVRLKTLKRLRRLQCECEKQKRYLSAQTQRVVISLDALVGSVPLVVRITREEFNDINQNIWERCTEVVRGVLKSSGLNKNDIQDVILVGGSSRIPRVQEILSDFFGGKKFRRIDNPDEAVALGASMLAFNRDLLQGPSVTSVLQRTITALDTQIDVKQMILVKSMDAEKSHEKIQKLKEVIWKCYLDNLSRVSLVAAGINFHLEIYPVIREKSVEELGMYWQDQSSSLIYSQILKSLKEELSSKWRKPFIDMFVGKNGPRMLTHHMEYLSSLDPIPDTAVHLFEFINRIVNWSTGTSAHKILEAASFKESLQTFIKKSFESNQENIYDLQMWSLLTCYAVTSEISSNSWPFNILQNELVLFIRQLTSTDNDVSKSKSKEDSTLECVPFQFSILFVSQLIEKSVDDNLSWKVVEHVAAFYLEETSDEGYSSGSSVFQDEDTLKLLHLCLFYFCTRKKFSKRKLLEDLSLDKEYLEKAFLESVESYIKHLLLKESANPGNIGEICQKQNLSVVTKILFRYFVNFRQELKINLRTRIISLVNGSHSDGRLETIGQLYKLLSTCFLDVNDGSYVEYLKTVLRKHTNFYKTLDLDSMEELREYWEEGEGGPLLYDYIVWQVLSDKNPILSQDFADAFIKFGGRELLVHHLQFLNQRPGILWHTKGLLDIIMRLSYSCEHPESLVKTPGFIRNIHKLTQKAFRHHEGDFYKYQLWCLITWFGLFADNKALRDDSGQEWSVDSVGLEMKLFLEHKSEEEKDVRWYGLSRYHSNILSTFLQATTKPGENVAVRAAKRYRSLFKGAVMADHRWNTV